jgi:hypothetical protein
MKATMTTALTIRREFTIAVPSKRCYANDCTDARDCTEGRSQNDVLLAQSPIDADRICRYVILFTISGGTTMGISRLPVMCLCAALMVGGALAVPAHAQGGKAAQKQVMIEGVGALDITRVTVAIEAVDVKNRIVTIRGPLGGVYSVPVGPGVQSLPQLKVGDLVEIDHYESIAVAVKKTEGKPSLTVTDVAAKGDSPGAIALRRIGVVTNVLGINTETQSILIRGPLGHLTQVKVKDPKVLSQLSAGGQVDLTYVEGLAIAVTPAKGK